jgi:hypothetical protein
MESHVRTNDQKLAESCNQQNAPGANGIDSGNSTQPRQPVHKNCRPIRSFCAGRAGQTTHFRATLETILSSRNMTQTELASKASMGKSKLSRLLNGQTGCSQNDLHLFVQAVDSPQDKVDLIIAHILDEVPASALNYIRLEARNGESTPVSRMESKNRELYQALDFVSQHSLPSMATMVLELAGTLRRSSVRKTRCKSTKAARE